MNPISRRTALGLMIGTAVPPTAVVAVAAASPREPAFDLQHWLNTSDPAEVAQYHAARLAEIMGAINPARSWRSHIDHEKCFALIVGDERPMANRETRQ